MNVIELCKRAGLTVGTNISGVTLVGSPSTPGIAHITVEELERFATLTRAEALEEAADVVEDMDTQHPRYIAAAIRALKEKT